MNNKSIELAIAKCIISRGFEVIPNPKTKRFMIIISKIDEKYLENTRPVIDYQNNNLKKKSSISLLIQKTLILF